MDFDDIRVPDTSDITQDTVNLPNSIKMAELLNDMQPSLPPELSARVLAQFGCRKDQQPRSICMGMSLVRRDYSRSVRRDRRPPMERYADIINVIVPEGRVRNDTVKLWLRLKDV